MILEEYCMAPKGNQGLTREQAAELYKDLQKTLHQIKDGDNTSTSNNTTTANKKYVSAARARLSGEMNRMNMFKNMSFPINGNKLAIGLIALLGLTKIGLSLIEYSGITEIPTAQASQTAMTRTSLSELAVPHSFSREEVEILTQLDTRRAELEARDEKLSDREKDIDRKEMELAARLTELRSLTDELRIKRDQTDRRRDGQLEQLSKVYSSMAPDEAAKLMEQLDITISLSLLKRMPEKRIAQVLALMNPERALALTQMLSQ